MAGGVALKVPHSALGQALGVERFQSEIRSQARLHHRHILPVFDSGIATGHLYHVMPHVVIDTRWRCCDSPPMRRRGRSFRHIWRRSTCCRAISTGLSPRRARC